MRDEERAVLVECLRRQREIAARAEPPARDRWGRREWEELREYGPSYRPAEWFGDGSPIPEKYRTRFLRAVHALAAAGLVRRTGVGGRLTNVKLTPEGERVAGELVGAAATGEGKPTGHEQGEVTGVR